MSRPDPGGPRMRRLALLFSLTLVAVVGFAVQPTEAVHGRIGFGAPFLVDAGRAGGEPSIFQITTGKYTGQYLYASHAGTTQLYKDNAAAIGDWARPYRNQTYIWRSRDA